MEHKAEIWIHLKMITSHTGCRCINKYSSQCRQSTESQTYSYKSLQVPDSSGRIPRTKAMLDLSAHWHWEDGGWWWIWSLCSHSPVQCCLIPMPQGSIVKRLKAQSRAAPKPGGGIKKIPVSFEVLFFFFFFLRMSWLTAEKAKMKSWSAAPPLVRLQRRCKEKVNNILGNIHTNIRCNNELGHACF